MSIVFFDLDGTLWDMRGNIPQSAVRAVRAARKNGHRIWVNTGRARSFVRKPELFEMGLDGIVCGCGTMIERARTGQMEIGYEDNDVIFYREMDRELALETVGVLKRHRIHSFLEGRDNLYVDVEEFGKYPYLEYVAQEMGERLLPITGYEGKWRFNKLSCDLRDAVDMEGALQFLNVHFHRMVHDRNVSEFIPKGCSKAEGLKQVCALEGIDVRDSIAFGDGGNDLLMLEAAGLGVCMGNGTEVAKEAADLVTAAVYEDGVALALTRLGLIDQKDWQE